MAVSEKLKLQKRFLADMEQKNKAKADVQKVEAVQGDLNEVKGSLEQQFTQVSRMQTNIEFRIKENTVKIVKSRWNNQYIAITRSVSERQGRSHQASAEEYGCNSLRLQQEDHRGSFDHFPSEADPQPKAEYGRIQQADAIEAKSHGIRKMVPYQAIRRPVAVFQDSDLWPSERARETD